MTEKKQELKDRHRQFMLRFFTQEKDHYVQKEVNGYWLVKYWDGNNDQWTVSLYTEESLHKQKSFFDSINH